MRSGSSIGLGRLGTIVLCVLASMSGCSGAEPSCSCRPKPLADLCRSGHCPVDLQSAIAEARSSAGTFGCDLFKQGEHRAVGYMSASGIFYEFDGNRLVGVAAFDDQMRECSRECQGGTIYGDHSIDEVAAHRCEADAGCGFERCKLCDGPIPPTDHEEPCTPAQLGQ